MMMSVNKEMMMMNDVTMNKKYKLKYNIKITI